MTAQRWVIVATYGEVYQADLAKAVLEEEGIAVELHDRETVSMDWLLSNTVGGIKVKVAWADAERATQILAAKLSAPGSYMAESLSEEELARQAMEAMPEEGFTVEPVKAYAEPDAEPTADTGSADAEREEYARRFHRAAVYSILLSFVCFAFWFYAVYLGLNAVFSPGRLSAEGQKRILYGFIACCGSFVFWLIGLIFFGPFFRDF